MLFYFMLLVRIKRGEVLPPPLDNQSTLKRIVPDGSRCGLIWDAVPAVLLRLFVLVKTGQAEVHNRARFALVLPSRRTVFARCGDF